MAIVVSDVMIPRPIDVPRSGASRLIAASTSAWSLVGTWTEKPLSLNATTPIRTDAGWRSTNARAAALAASIRVGSRSVGGHAARHVEREDHRALDPRHADDALRSGQRDDEDRQPGEDDSAAGSRRRNARPATRAVAKARPRATAVCRDAAPARALAHDVERDAERNRRQEQQHRAAR